MKEIKMDEKKKRMKEEKKMKKIIISQQEAVLHQVQTLQVKYDFKETKVCQKVKLC